MTHEPWVSVVTRRETRGLSARLERSNRGRLRCPLLIVTAKTHTLAGTHTHSSPRSHAITRNGTQGPESTRSALSRHSTRSTSGSSEALSRQTKLVRLRSPSHSLSKAPSSLTAPRHAPAAAALTYSAALIGSTRALVGNRSSSSWRGARRKGRPSPCAPPPFSSRQRC